MQSFYVKNRILSNGSDAKNYIIREMIEMTERELSSVPYGEFHKSDYRWIIGENIASAIFTNLPTRILDFDAVYESSQIFDPNIIDFVKKSGFGCGDKPKIVCHLYQDSKKLVGDLQNGYFYVDTDTAYKIEESKRRAKEMDVMADISNLYPKQLSYLPMTNYNEMYIKKEDKKMDIKLYECGPFVRGEITKPQDLIKNVVFSGPCTIVQWTDGDKTIVRCENEDFDHEKGLAMAIVKKFFGTNETKSNYNDIFKKWIKEEKKEESSEISIWPVVSNNKDNYAALSENIKANPHLVYLTVKEVAIKDGVSESTIRKKISKGQFFGAKKVDGIWWIPFSK